MENYSNEYFNKHCNGSYNSAKIVLKLISSIYEPQTVVDFGCGVGSWLKAAKEIFNGKVLGFDTHIYDGFNMNIDKSEYSMLDITIPLNTTKMFDMAICVEVLEHIEEKYSDEVIKTLCKQSEFIIFSAAVPLQGGTGHVNEQPISYWANKFSKHGYLAIDYLRPHIWNNENVDLWYRNNIIIYVSEKLYFRLRQKISLKTYPLDILHPQMHERILNRSKKNG